MVARPKITKKPAIKKKTVTKTKKAAPKKVAPKKKTSPKKVVPKSSEVKRKYPTRMPDEVVDHAKLLYFIVDEELRPVYSLWQIARTLKRTYPDTCKTITNMTVFKWEKRFGWGKDREESISSAYVEAKDVQERQEVYKRTIVGRFGFEIAELNALIQKPATHQQTGSIPQELRENEKALLESTQKRLGLVLVEMRGLNSAAFNELIRRDKNTRELVYRPSDRTALLQEYKLTSELLIKLYGIRILQKMAGMEDNFEAGPQSGGPTTAAGEEFTDEFLRQCNILLPEEVVGPALKFLRSKEEADDERRRKNASATKYGSSNEPNSSEEIIEVEPTKKS